MANSLVSPSVQNLLLASSEEALYIWFG